MSRVSGFSLIELFVVISIIALLSALAIPSYGDYVVKARVVELLAVANAYKLNSVERLFAAEDQQAVYNLNTELVDYVSLNTVDGQPAKHIIQVVAKMKTRANTGIGLSQPDAANGALTIQLQGVEHGELIAWSCHVSPEYNKYVPRSCQNNNLEAIIVG